MENFDESLKVIVVGNGQVGKSSMLRRYCKGDFTGEYKKTIGTDYLEKDVYLKEAGENVRMLLWDTAGQEVFNSLTSSYYRGAGACVLAFSTTDRDSFTEVKRWKERVEEVCGVGAVVMALIQTKVDLIETESAVGSAEAEELAKQLGVKFFRTSTKTNFNIDPVFEYLGETYLAQKGNEAAAPAPEMTIKQGVSGQAEEPAPVAETKPQTSGKIALDKPKERATRKKFLSKC